MNNVPAHGYQLFNEEAPCRAQWACFGGETIMCALCVIL